MYFVIIFLYALNAFAEYPDNKFMKSACVKSDKSFHLSSHINTKQLKMSDVYKVIDQDAAELRQQVKWEKERLKHMKKVSGVEMLLGHGVL
jgi:ribosome-associated translation inhibitor RaiA